jgi:hypothetical protein
VLSPDNHGNTVYKPNQLLFVSAIEKTIPLVSPTVSQKETDMPTHLQIFKAGTHTPQSGQSIRFSEADLIKTIAAYDPAKHEAPLVVGHPAVDAPAYGWVTSLSFADGTILAEPGQVDPAFAELVNKGTFKKISASFYRPSAANNPVPGVFYLRHVGFLGGQAPAIKGLKSASFADSEEGVVSFGDYEDQIESGLWRRLKNWMIGKEGIDAAEVVFPEFELNTLAQDAYQPEAPDQTDSALPNFTEGSMNQKEFDEQKAALDTQAVAFAEREAALKVKEEALVIADNVNFAEGLVAKGILAPAQKESAVALLSLAAGLSAPVSFAEGKDHADILRDFLSNQPKIVAFGEFAGDAADEASSVSFAAPPGFTVDAANLELHNKALAYQQKNPGMEYMTAVKVCS